MSGRDRPEGWDPFPNRIVTNESQDRRLAKRAVSISALGLLVTGLLELVVALFAHSAGLLGDALHNLSDVSTSLAVFGGLRYSKRLATSKFTYGWERAEDLAGLAIAVMIWISAIAAAYLSINKLISHSPTHDIAFGIAASAIGIIGNQVVARYKLKVGRKIQSATLIADAQHSWLDALSSAGAMAGLIGVGLGFAPADAIAGLIVTAFICHVGYEVTSEIIGHLMDSVDAEITTKAIEVVSSCGSFDSIAIRARWIGRTLLLEVDCYSDGSLTLNECDSIRLLGEERLAEAIPEVRVVHWRSLASNQS